MSPVPVCLWGRWGCWSGCLSVRWWVSAGIDPAPVTVCRMRTLLLHLDLPPTVLPTGWQAHERVPLGGCGPVAGPPGLLIGTLPSGGGGRWGSSTGLGAASCAVWLFGGTRRVCPAWRPVGAVREPCGAGRTPFWLVAGLGLLREHGWPLVRLIGRAHARPAGPRRSTPPGVLVAWSGPAERLLGVCAPWCLCCGFVGLTAGLGAW